MELAQCEQLLGLASQLNCEQLRRPENFLEGKECSKLGCDDG